MITRKQYIDKSKTNKKIITVKQLNNTHELKSNNNDTNNNSIAQSCSTDIFQSSCQNYYEFVTPKYH